MIPFLKKLFTDETAFTRFFRSIVAFSGIMLAGGILPVQSPWMKTIGAIAVAAAHFLGAGEMNQKAETQNDN